MNLAALILVLFLSAFQSFNVFFLNRLCLELLLPDAVLKLLNQLAGVLTLFGNLRVHFRPQFLVFCLKLFVLGGCPFELLPTAGKLLQIFLLDS